MSGISGEMVEQLWFDIIDANFQELGKPKFLRHFYINECLKDVYLYDDTYKYSIKLKPFKKHLTLKVESIITDVKDHITNKTIMSYVDILDDYSILLMQTFEQFVHGVNNANFKYASFIQRATVRMYDPDVFNRYVYAITGATVHANIGLLGTDNKYYYMVPQPISVDGKFVKTVKIITEDERKDYDLDGYIDNLEHLLFGDTFEQ